MANKQSLILTLVDFRLATAIEDSRSKILQKVVLGGLKLKTISRSAGGGVMDRDIPIPRLQAIELGISVNGFDRDLMPGLRDRWTMGAAMRNRRGDRIPVRLDIGGEIAEWMPDEVSPEEFKGCNSAVKDIDHINLIINGEEWFYADEEEGEIRRMGVSLTAADRTAAGI